MGIAGGGVLRRHPQGARVLPRLSFCTFGGTEVPDEDARLGS